MFKIEISLSAIILSGCASYSIEKDGTSDGYDVYRPEPYILVVVGQDDKGNEVRQATLIWLPNYGIRYRIDTFNFLAKADFEFQIDNGWMLTQIADKGDSTAIPAPVLEAIKAVGAAPATKPAAQPMELYKIIYDKSGNVTGVQQMF